MKILLSHGFHSEGKLFGAEVCGEYIRKYSPSEESVVVRRIENSALRNDVIGKRRAHGEISHILEEESPDIFLDIQTLGSAPVSQQEMRSGAIGQALAGLGMDLSKEELPLFQEIGSGIMQQRLAGIRRMFTDPIKYAFLNPEINPALYQLLEDQNFAYNVVDHLETRERIRKVAPSVETADKKNISYIWLGAAVNEDGERVIEDEFSREAFDRTINFIDVLRHYVESSKD